MCRRKIYISFKQLESFKALAHTMEKSVEVKSWKVKLASTSVNKFRSTKKNKRKIFDNKLAWQLK